MKKLLLFSLSVYTVTLSALLAADPDLVKGVDFTGLTSVSPSKLNQLVDNAYVGGNRGLVIYTNTPPDVVTEPKLKRYLWVDTTSVIPVVKVYYTNAPAGWSNITAVVSVAANSITAAMIQGGAVTTAKIPNNAIVNALLGNQSVDFRTLGLNVISNANIAAFTLTSASIATNGITSDSIAALAITGSKIANGSISNAHLATAFSLAGTNIANATITSNNIAGGAIVLTNLSSAGVTALQYIRMNAGATALEWGLPAYTNSQTVTSSVSLTNILNGVQNIPHTLAARPSHVVVSIVCTDAGGDAGFSLNDEVAAYTIQNGNYRNPWTFSWDASNVNVSCNNAVIDITTVYIYHKTTGAQTGINTSKWKFRASVSK